MRQQDQESSHQVVNTRSKVSFRSRQTTKIKYQVVRVVGEQDQESSRQASEGRTWGSSVKSTSLQRRRSRAKLSGVVGQQRRSRVNVSGVVGQQRSRAKSEGSQEGQVRGQVSSQRGGRRQRSTVKSRAQSVKLSGVGGQEGYEGQAVRGRRMQDRNQVVRGRQATNIHHKVVAVVG